ncbi:MAG: DUF4326 domain-containing protein [Promethearchaeota archaeon]
MPANTKNVGRLSRWGNPFDLTHFDLETSLELYRSWLEDELKSNPAFLDPLIGFDLGCYCPLSSKCHADILLEFLEIRIAQKPVQTTLTKFFEV